MYSVPFRHQQRRGIIIVHAIHLPYCRACERQQRSVHQYATIRIDVQPIMLRWLRPHRFDRRMLGHIRVIVHSAELYEMCGEHIRIGRFDIVYSMPFRYQQRRGIIIVHAIHLPHRRACERQQRRVQRDSTIWIDM